MSAIKLIGYAPDVDQTIEGVITSCSAFIPTEKGMQAAPSPTSAGAAALLATTYGAAAIRKLDNSFRVFAGTSTDLYELISTSWNSVTRAVGGAYALSADNFWRFTQFGDATLAIAKSDQLQVSLTGAFSNVAGAPKASIVETVTGFVFVFDTNEAIYGDSPNRWWCAAQNNYTDWTPALATQCATGLLVSAPGRIAAARKFGEQIIVYKERAMYIGTYVGASNGIWNFQQIVGDAGCSSQEAVVNIGTADNPVHIFMGADDFWRFDGARPVPIGSPLRKTVYAELDYKYSNRIKTLHDRVNSRVYFFYPSRNSTGVVDKCVVYHYRENKWGRDDRTIESAMEYLSGGISWDTIPYATWDSIPTSLSWDSPFWTAGNLSSGIIDTTHTLYVMSGVASNSSFTTNDLGDDNNFYLLSRVKPVWLTAPTSATLTNFYKASEGDALTQDFTKTMILSRFDLLRSARWHRLQFNMVGDCVLTDMNIEYQIDGEE